jgi:hypothetical protein
MNPLEPYLDYIKYALIAIIPALLIYFIEQSTITSLKAQLAAAKEEIVVIPPPTHLFTSKDLSDVATLETESEQVTQNIDRYKPVSNNMNELICMQGMRNSAASYLTSMVSQLYQEMGVSVSSANQDDVKFADKQILGTASSTIRFIPNIQNNLRQIMMSCRGSQTVSYTNSTIMRFMDKLRPTLTAYQTRIIKAK